MGVYGRRHLNRNQRSVLVPMCVAQVLKDGVQRLQIRSYVPYADPDELIRIIKRAVDKHKMGVTGTSSVFGGVRTWCVHLLTEECKLSNRDAIKLWNEELGESCGYTYTMEDSTNYQQEFRVTSPGEPQFSKEKKVLEERIDHYQKILTSRRPHGS